MLQQDSYTLGPEDYIITTANGHREFYQHSDPSELTQCTGSFMSYNLNFEGKKVWILGDIFLSKYTVFFDYDNNKIGFAPKQ